jgi:hypothetical protein
MFFFEKGVIKAAVKKEKMPGRALHSYYVNFRQRMQAKTHQFSQFYVLASCTAGLQS